MTKRIRNNAVDIGILVICFLASGVVSVYLGQDNEFDLKNYHFYNAYAFLNNRLTYDIAPAQIETFINPLLEVPFYFLMTHIPPVLYGFIVGGVQGLNIWLVYKITYSILSDMSEAKRQFLSLSAGITGYYGLANLIEIGTNHHDNITSLFVLAGVLVMVLSIQARKVQPLYLSKKYIIAAGLLMGCGTGLKLVLAIYALPMMFAMLFIRSVWRVRITNAVVYGFSVCIGIILTHGYWSIVLYKNFHSPLFPYFNKIFKSPYYETVNFSNYYNIPHDTLKIIFHPFYMIADISDIVPGSGFSDIRFVLCYILLTLFMCMILYRLVLRMYYPRKTLSSFKLSSSMGNTYTFIVAFFILSYILWQYMFSSFRFIIPLEFLSPVIIILVFRYFFKSERTVTRLSIVTFALIIINLSPTNIVRMPWPKDYFDVRIPEIESIERSIIIMAGYDPLSYVIPFFPESTKFVRVQSKHDFTGPSSKTLLQEKIRSVLRNFKGNMYLLYKEKRDKGVNYNNVLEAYNLKIIKDKGERLHTKFDNDLILFPVDQVR